MIGLLLLGIALGAEPQCEPLTEADLADRIHASLDAIQRADVGGHLAIIEDLELRLACLDFVPSPERWAELLVGMAIVTFAEGGDWEAPLDTALRVHPNVDLLVGPTHPFRSWVPETSEAQESRVVPDGVRIYLDGELVSEVALTSGLHLAQRRTGDGWESMLLRSDELPEAWFEEPSLLQRRRLRASAELDIGGGAGSLSQSVDQAGTWLADTGSTRPSFGLAVRGSIGSGNLPGAYLDGQMPRLGAASGSLAHAGIEIAPGPARFQLGGGVLAHTAEDGEGPHTAVRPLPVVGLGLATRRLDAMGQAGTVPGALRLGARVGVSPGAGLLGLRVGLTAWRQTARWSQVGQRRDLEVTDQGLGLTVGGRLWRSP